MSQSDCGFPAIEIKKASDFNSYFSDKASCDTINYPITIENVVDLRPLNFIKKLNHRLIIRITDSDLENLIGLDSLEEATTISISGATIGNLKTINAFTSLRKLEQLKIAHAPSLTHIEPIPQLDSLHSFENSFNRSLESLDFLPNLKHCRFLEVLSNDNLESISFTQNLSNVNKLNISNCPKLEELYLPKESKEMISIVFNRLDNLKTIHSNENETKEIISLFLAFLPKLESFPGLNFLEKVNAFFAFRECDKLISIGNFPNLDTVSLLGLINNDILEDISGLENLGYISDSLHVVENPNLSACNVESFCSFVNRKLESSVLFDNATSCSSAEELANSCVSTNVFEELELNNIQVYPNPVGDNLHIEIPSRLLGQKYSVIDNNGREYKADVFTYNSNQINLTDFVNGIYYLKIGDKSYKFLKM